MEEIIRSGDTIELRGLGSYNIYLEDKLIGHLETQSNCKLMDIQIDSEYRGNGYGREAIELFIEIAEEANCSTISTSAVLHGAVQHVLEDNGFTMNPDTRRYKKEI